MTKYKCSTCNFESYHRHVLDRHIIKKKPCGDGERKVIIVHDILVCTYCNKEYELQKSLIAHLKKCPVKKYITEEENRLLKEKIKKLERNQVQTQINNNNQINITLINYNETDLSKLTDKCINDLIIDADKSCKIIPNLIKHIHFNPEMPEYHNICLSNKNSNNKYMNVFRDGIWQAAIKNIDNIISDKETQLGDWVTEKGKKFPAAKEKYDDYLEQKYEPGIAKLIKEEVELILYNGRHMIKI